MYLSHRLVCIHIHRHRIRSKCWISCVVLEVFNCVLQALLLYTFINAPNNNICQTGYLIEFDVRYLMWNWTPKLKVDSMLGNFSDKWEFFILVYNTSKISMKCHSMSCTSKVRRNAFSVIDVCEENVQSSLISSRLF